MAGGVPADTGAHTSSDLHIRLPVPGRAWGGDMTALLVVTVDGFAKRVPLEDIRADATPRAS